MIIFSNLTEHRLFKKAVILVILATLLGIACCLPDLISYAQHGKNYEPFTHNFLSDTQFDETSWYAPSANFFKETLQLPFETDIYEYRHLVNLKYALPIMIDGSTALLFGDLRAGRMFSHFFFPFFCLLLVFSVAYNASKNFYTALFSSLLFCVFALGPRRLLSFFDSNLLNQPLLIARMTSPAATLPIFLLALSGLQKICEGKDSHRFTAQTAVFCGLTFFSYYYYQLAVCSALFFLWVFAFVTNRKITRIIFWTSIGTFLVGLPWFFQIAITLKQNPTFFEIHQAPPGDMLVRAKMFTSFLLSWGFFLGVLRVLHQHLIKTNKSGIWNAYTPLYFLWFSAVSLRYCPPFHIIQPAHFTTHIIWPFFILTLSLLSFGHFVIRYPEYSKAVAKIFLGVLLLLMFFKQGRVAEHTRDYLVADSAERTAENLIRENTSKEDVIAMEGVYFNSVISARVWRYKFYAGYYGMGNIPAEENVERYLFVQKLFGHSWEEVRRQLISSHNLFITTPYLLTLKREFSSEEIFKYEKIFSEMDVAFLKKKKINYIICLDEGQKRRMEFQASQLHLPLVLTAEKNGVFLFQIVPASKT